MFSDLIVNSFNFIICMVKKKKIKDQSGIMQNFKPDPKSWGQTGKGPRFHLGLHTECLEFPTTSVAYS